MFRRAIFLLTLQYSFVLFAIFAVFSFGIYRYMDITFGGDYIGSLSAAIQEDAQGNELPDLHAIGAKEATDVGLDKLKTGLLTIDTGLLFLIPLLSYVIARRMLLPIQASYNAQKHFVDNAAHELRTPLAIVRGELELALTKSRSQEEYQAAIGTSLEKVSSLSALVSELLILARGNTPALQKTFTTVSVNDLVDKVLSRVKDTYPDHNAILKNGYLDLNLYGNPELLEQVLLNIIDNACKFSVPNKPIHIKASKVKGKIIIAVQDSGIGMNQMESKQAFNRFYRAESSRTTKGHGLGLSLVQELVALHGGVVTLLSEKGAGTTVTITLPGSHATFK